MWLSLQDPGLMKALVENGGVIGILAAVCLTLVAAIVLLTRSVVKMLGRVILEALSMRDSEWTSYGPSGESRNSGDESSGTRDNGKTARSKSRPSSRR